MMWGTAWSATVVMLALIPFAELQEKKQDIPSDAAQKEAEKTIKGLFKDDYAKRAPADRQALAKNLLKQGTETKDSPAAQYVLFRESQEIAAKAGDIETAFKSVDEMSRIYAVNPISLKNAALAQVSAIPRTAEEQKGLAQAYMTLADEAAQARQYDVAAKASQSALAAARKIKDIPFLTKAEAQSKAMSTVQEKFEKVRKWMEVLAATPDNPEANQSVGEFECFIMGDWDSGLGKLAKGADPALKSLAARDLSKPTETADQAAVGDGWWDRAEKESGQTKSNLRLRAAYWYEQALQKLSGLSKVKIEKRLEEPGLTRGLLNSIDLLVLVDLKRDIVSGKWSQTGPSLVSSQDVTCLQFPYAPGDEYDLTVVVQRKEGGNALIIGLPVGTGATRHLTMMQFDAGPGGDAAGLVGSTTIPGRLLGDTKRAYTIVCMIRKTGVTVQLEGKKICEHLGDLGVLHMPSNWVLPSKEAPWIGAWTTSFVISKVAVTPVTGQGRKLR